ncbi:F17-like fimbrial chaperone [Escherichia coli]|uniref:fimbria/pilus periplasmic chaperone n=1 Tax=Escherichia coli TaxID=562 RepID=UPI000E04BCC2|nr:fimbria/pilus periplasmic chaperone [Escherichia coli]STJ32249.1 F17-like fimbrial chaperone [Escherichia coli]
MKHILLFIFTVLLSLPSYGSVVIMGTRVIYPAEQKSINVRLNNGDSTPSLIQAWLDTGDPSSPPDSVRVPFIITPPVFRVEPLSGQTMRIMYTGENLPADRESLFLAECSLIFRPNLLLPENLKKHRDIITSVCRTKPD